LRKFADRAHEVGASRNGAAVDVRGPKHRLAAVDEEAARRRSVRDDPLCAHAEPGVRVLLVRRDPAARVAAPAELGEGVVEAVGQSG
jgi:hypothetical protein